MTDPSEDYLTIHSLNDLLYCERRCALHRIENVWVDNAHTVSGTFAHQRADKPVDWKCGDGREVHGLWLKSDRLRLVGKADVVEFQRSPLSPRADGTHERGERGGVSPPVASAGENIEHTGGLTPPRSPDESQNEIPYPVEYKRGKKRKWDNDDVQLCAQALCLEEMLGVAVPRGAIFHIKTKRRRVVSRFMIFLPG
jgi:CRISPR-associated exonuclease Cas4